jgi:homocysteine S-methyltransferase
MARYDRLLGRMQAGETILIDGGTGTEVERRGVPQLENAWNGGGILSHPQIVQQVHEDFLREGAEIVISNTFATSRHALREAGQPERFETYNRHGVELALAARDAAARPEALVAGGISYWSWAGEPPPPDVVRSGVADQAAIMAEAGADLLMLEMMVDKARMLAALEAARGSGLPVWAGLSCTRDDAGRIRLLRGEPLAPALEALHAAGVPLVCIMHTDVALVDDCLDEVFAHWPGLVGVYAHSGQSDRGSWRFETVMPPQDHARAAQRWLARGVRLIGGCCGMGPDHVKALKGVI